MRRQGGGLLADAPYMAPSAAQAQMYDDSSTLNSTLHRDTDAPRPHYEYGAGMLRREDAGAFGGSVASPADQYEYSGVKDPRVGATLHDYAYEGDGGDADVDL